LPDPPPFALRLRSGARSGTKTPGKIRAYVAMSGSDSDSPSGIDGGAGGDPRTGGDKLWTVADGKPSPGEQVAMRTGLRRSLRGFFPKALLANVRSVCHTALISNASGGWVVVIDTRTLAVSELSESHASALQDSTVLLTRFFFDAANELSEGKRVEDTWLAEYLPMRYSPLYDGAFARRFVTCLLAVSARLWSDDPYRPACVAEQLAFRALLDFAQAALEERGIEPEFGPAWEQAFDNLGVSVLFDEVHAVEPRLAFENWFQPIDDGYQLHPSIRFQDDVRARIS